MTTARETVNALAEYRRRKGIMQITIAKRMGKTPAAITMLETRQDRNPKWSTVTHYAHALGVRLENIPEDAPVSPKSVVPLVECVDEAAREEQG